MVLWVTGRVDVAEHWGEGRDLEGGGGVACGGEAGSWEDSQALAQVIGWTVALLVAKRRPGRFLSSVV